MCDTGCRHCLDDSGTRNPVHFTEKMAQQIVDEAREGDYGLEVLFSGGGEPLMATELLGITEAFGGYEKTGQFVMITSGFTDAEKDGFRKGQLEALLDMELRKNIHVEHSFNLYHPSFSERFKNAIELLIENGKDFMSARICMSRENIIETWTVFEETINLAAHSLDAKNIFRLPLGWHHGNGDGFFSALGRIARKPNRLGFLTKESFLINQWYVMIVDGERMILVDAHPISLEKIGRGKNIKGLPYNPFYYCDAFDEDGSFGTALFISPNGNVYPGCNCNNGSDEMYLGKIGRDSLIDIVGRKRNFCTMIMREILASKAEFQWMTYDTCRICRQIAAKKGFDLK